MQATRIERRTWIQGVPLLLGALMVFAPTVATCAEHDKRAPPPKSVPSTGVREPKMVTLETGCFEMGSPSNEPGRGNDERQHRVCVESFAMSTHEVSVDEFGRFVESSGYATGAEQNAGGKSGCYGGNDDARDWRPKRNWRAPGFEHDEHHPVVCVSFNDAAAYAAWLAKETGRHYRLPTEAEWEYAARAGTTSARFWGDNADAACAHANVADDAARARYSNWTVHDCSDGWVHTAPVGQFAATSTGLHDMLGNVWEWTCSAYDKTYYGGEKECAASGSGDLWVVRGGSWLNGPHRLRSADRDRASPQFRSVNQGFRLAEDL